MLVGDVACRVFGNLGNLVGEIRVAECQLEVVQTLRHVFRRDVFCKHDADVGQHECRNIDGELISSMSAGQLAKLREIFMRLQESNLIK